MPTRTPIIEVYKNDFSDHGFDTWNVVIDDGVYEMSADAHMPNGCCHYLGKRKDVGLMSADLLSSWDKIPIGVCRKILDIVVFYELGSIDDEEDHDENDPDGDFEDWSEDNEATYAANEAKTDEGNTE